MSYNNKYQDGQKVIVKETGKVVTVDRWGYVKKMNRYSYTILEQPGTFYFESELRAHDRTEQIKPEGEAKWRD